MKNLKNVSTLSVPSGTGGDGCPWHRLKWASAEIWQEVAIAVLTVVVLRFIFIYFFALYQKNQRPGQVRCWPIVGSTMTLNANMNGLHDFLAELHEKNEVVWITYPFGLDGLYITDPASTEHMLKINFPNYPKGDEIQLRMRELLGHGIFAADGQEWKDTRKVASFQFSSAILRNFSADVFREGAIVLSRIVSQFAQSRLPMDMQNLFMRLTLDTTCKVGLGVELGCLSPSLPDVPFAKHFDLANELSFSRYLDPLWKFKKFLNIGNEKCLRKCVEGVDAFSYNIINQRRIDLEACKKDGSKVRPDLLSRFMSVLENSDEVFSDKVLRDHVVNFIIAGRDTSAVTLSWFIYMLCLNPEVAEKIFEEVTCLEQNESSPYNAEREDDPFIRFAEVLTFYNVGKLQYLHAALTETLRLYPPVHLDGKVADKDDVFPNGVKVKKGYLITYNAYAMGRLERIWGPDAKQYKPERWLKDGIFHQESPFKFVSFHAGNRQCLGKESAYLQMKMTAALLIRFFKFELVPDQNIQPRLMFVLTMKEGVQVIATPR
ncbi:hypothetical protein R1flu_002419 [Riccia fluitans]|uniref:Cytochrome P450 n=1 Tax=Riccia fluitans TaxID=41844 RepID=A0ABD1Y631_9MARC